jgi:hypothetical protein
MHFHAWNNLHAPGEERMAAKQVANRDAIHIGQEEDPVISHKPSPVAYDILPWK